MIFRFTSIELFLIKKFVFCYIRQLSAPCGSGKSATMNFISCAAQADDCWTLILLNIGNNPAVKGLESKFDDVNLSMGITSVDMPVETDGIFRSYNKTKFEKLCNEKMRGTWICKADERIFAKLLDKVSDEAWARCVVIFDEVHCFFSLEDEKCKKKAEINMWKLLYGPSLESSEYQVSNMRVRSVVFSDATDGDFPHVLKHGFQPKENEFVKIHADMVTLKARGYVSGMDHRLFDGGLDMVMKKKQWFGKDFRERTKDLTGKEFAEQIELVDYHPKFRSFFEDALAKDICEAPNFALELTSVNKSVEGSNSVEHHAQANARLFPGCLALAEHGGGCFHFDQEGNKTKYKSHREAHDHLIDAYRGRPKYLITNIGYGSMTYSFPGYPVTHLYIGFKEEDNNILVKAQGAGRACGYIQADLDLREGHVKFLCTPKDFEDTQKGLAQFIREAYFNYPNHETGTYTNDIVVKNKVGHARNPGAAKARVLATVVTNGADAGSSSGGAGGSGSLSMDAEEVEVQDRTRLYESVRDELIDEQIIVSSGSPEKMIIREMGNIVVSEARSYLEHLKNKYPDALQTTRVVFVTGSTNLLDDQDKRPRDISTSLGKALRAEQISDLPYKTPKTGGIWADKKLCFYNGNAAHFGKNGGKNPESKYRMLWAFDPRGRQMVGIIKTVALADLTLPFINQVYSARSRLGPCGQ